MFEHNKHIIAKVTNNTITNSGSGFNEKFLTFEYHLQSLFIILSFGHETTIYLMIIKHIILHKIMCSWNC